MRNIPRAAACTNQRTERNHDLERWAVTLDCNLTGCLHSPSRLGCSRLLYRGPCARPGPRHLHRLCTHACVHACMPGLAWPGFSLRSATAAWPPAEHSWAGLRGRRWVQAAKLLPWLMRAPPRTSTCQTTTTRVTTYPGTQQRLQVKRCHKDKGGGKYSAGLNARHDVA